jgi:hypothetical protein
MRIHTTPEGAETAFFDALLHRDVMELESLLTDDFLLVDVMSGSEVRKADLLGVLASGQLTFLEIDRLESHTRYFGPTGESDSPGSTAVVVGRTHMRMQFMESEVTAASRYTHVYVEIDGSWRFVTAQGTPITAPE